MTFHKRVPFELWLDNEKGDQTNATKQKQQDDQDMYDGNIKEQLAKCVVPDSTEKGKGGLGKLWMSPSQEVVNYLIFKPRLQKRKEESRDSAVPAGLTKEEYDIRKRIAAAVKEKMEYVVDRFEKVLPLIIKKVHQEGEKRHLIALADAECKIRAAHERQKEEALNALRVELETAYKKTLNLTVDSMQEEMKNTLHQQEQKLTLDFCFKLEREANSIFEDYQEKLKKQLERWIEYLHKAKLGEEIKRKRMLDLSNAENDMSTMQMLIEERERQAVAENKLKTQHEQQISEMEETLHQKEEIIEEIEHEKDTLARTIQLWECFSKEMLKQFQKFINYFLGEKPGQAEYLLNLEQVLNQRIYFMPKEEELSDILQESSESFPLFQEIVGEEEVSFLSTEKGESTTEESYEELVPLGSLEKTIDETVEEATRTSSERIVDKILWDIIRKITPATKSVEKIAQEIMTMIIWEALPTPAVGTPISSYPSITKEWGPEDEPSLVPEKDSSTKTYTDLKLLSSEPVTISDQLYESSEDLVRTKEYTSISKRSFGKLIDCARLAQREVKVAGESRSEAKERMDEFTKKRVASIERIFDKHPSIMKLFIQK